ncbi:hypothetical protein SAMN04488550_4145 [Gordonia malaquae]|nr:hypothetical protein SAMN04488550_4145 [Gordonia malaquae]
MAWICCGHDCAEALKRANAAGLVTWGCGCGHETFIPRDPSSRPMIDCPDRGLLPLDS